MPAHDAKLEVHPSTPFGDVRTVLTELSTSRYPGLILTLAAPGAERVSERLELYGRHGNAALEQVVVVRLEREGAWIGDAVAADDTALAEEARQRAGGRADLALLRVDDAAVTSRVVAATRILRGHGFERVTLSATDPTTIATRATGPRMDWVRNLETCPLAEGAPEDAFATLELRSDGRGGIGTVRIIEAAHRGSGYAAALCVSTQPFPPDVPSPVYRIRFRFQAG